MDRFQWNGSSPLHSAKEREIERPTSAKELAHGRYHQTRRRLSSKIRRKDFTSVSKTFPAPKLANDWGINTESEMLRGQYICRGSAENTTRRKALERHATEVAPEKPGAYTEL